MEILIIFFLIYFFLQYQKSSEVQKNKRLESSADNRIKEKPKKRNPTKNSQKKKPKTYKYSPGQVKKKPRIDPKSKLEPINPRKIVLCDICGSERMYRENMENCCD